MGEGGLVPGMERSEVISKNRVPFAAFLKAGVLKAELLEDMYPAAPWDHEQVTSRHQH